jgi:hypothetical protein
MVKRRDDRAKINAFHRRAFLARVVAPILKAL